MRKQEQILSVMPTDNTDAPVQLAAVTRVHEVTVSLPPQYLVV